MRVCVFIVTAKTTTKTTTTMRHNGLPPCYCYECAKRNAKKHESTRKKEQSKTNNLPPSKSSDFGVVDILFISVFCMDVSVCECEECSTRHTKDNLILLWPIYSALVVFLISPELFCPFTFPCVCVFAFCVNVCVGKNAFYFSFGAVSPPLHLFSQAFIVLD